MSLPCDKQKRQKAFKALNNDEDYGESNPEPIEFFNRAQVVFSCRPIPLVTELLSLQKVYTDGKTESKETVGQVKEDQSQKAGIALIAYAIVKPGAVMIEAFHAFVAHDTMNSRSIYQFLAVFAFLVR